MRNDDLMFAITLQDRVHRLVDALREHLHGLGARHTLIVPHPIPDSRRRDESLI